MGGSNVPHINPVLLTRKTTSSKRKSSTTGKKQHRFKPGTVSLREIRKLQKMGNTLVFARNPFEKYVREIFHEYNKDLKISKNVFTILQYSLESILVNLLTQSNNAAIHAGRVKMMPVDIDFVRRITKHSYLSNQSSTEFEIDDEDDDEEEQPQEEEDKTSEKSKEEDLSEED